MPERYNVLYTWQARTPKFARGSLVPSQNVSSGAKFYLFLLDFERIFLGDVYVRGWWTPLLFTSGITSAIAFLKHVLNQNTLAQARRNISHHYDMSNEIFAMFLGETMAYSCAIFKTEDEDLNTAQLRKYSLLIEKAQINKEHEVLEIGCGWGGLAIEVVKQTGCNYTGISLSKEQLKFAEMKVKEANLQDRVRFLLCDYRELPETYKYDRILSCEMVEHVGHEYMEEFFGCCESILAEDCIFVLQFSSVAEQDYDEARRTSGFVTEHIFPGGCLPSLTRITSAMGAASKLRKASLQDDEMLEEKFPGEPEVKMNIDLHCRNYAIYTCLDSDVRLPILVFSKILGMGFDEKFIRKWEYYFDYCAAGFKSETLGNYQVVFSRPDSFVA
ncbi:hypothetical protein GH714_005358 [Hevea brasiliensis]|uniref:Cyclopropane-fatty-acyl-phospholipid synthase n=1 Tax=Hevea brasiliensis TaxID=3981 RepID=A0A6A6KAW3_HEVBR|nr:hypothetical protein GH714_005358 [Hevea brasiliensis]